MQESRRYRHGRLTHVHNLVASNMDHGPELRRDPSAIIGPLACAQVERSIVHRGEGGSVAPTRRDAICHPFKNQQKKARYPEYQGYDEDGPQSVVQRGGWSGHGDVLGTVEVWDALMAALNKRGRRNSKSDALSWLCSLTLSQSTSEVMTSARHLQWPQCVCSL